MTLPFRTPQVVRVLPSEPRAPEPLPKLFSHWKDNEVVWWNAPFSHPGQVRGATSDAPRAPEIPLMAHLIPRPTAEPLTPPAAPASGEHAMREAWSRMAHAGLALVMRRRNEES